MSYDPRSDLFFDKMKTYNGKCIYIVNDDTARDALTGVEIEDICYTKADNLLNIFDGSAWIKSEGGTGSGIEIVADDAARDALNPNEPMIVVTEHDDLINIYDPATTAWIKRGAGLKKVYTFTDLNNLEGLKDGDTAVVTTTDELYTYNLSTNTWSLVVTGIREVASGSGWNIVEEKHYDNEQFDTTFDNLSNGKYLLIIDNIKDINGTDGFKIRFNGATTGYAIANSINPYSTTVYGASRSADCVVYTPENWDASMLTRNVVVEITAEDGYVCARATAQFYGGGRARSCEAINEWTGSLTSLQVMATTIGSAKVGLYRWENIRATELHSLQLIKELRFTNEVLDFTTAINSDDSIIIKGTARTVSGTTGNIGLQFNNDTGNNYSNRRIYGSGSAAASSVFTEAMWRLAYTNKPDKSMRFEANFDVYRETGDRLHGYGVITYDDAGDLRLYNNALFWNNTIDQVSSIRIFSEGVFVTGVVRIYKVVKTHLIDTAINKVTNETALLSAPVWDGRLAMTLDNKQLFVYDQPRKSWIGKSGHSMPRGIYAWKKLDNIELDPNQTYDFTVDSECRVVWTGEGEAADLWCQGDGGAATWNRQIIGVASNGDLQQIRNAGTSYTYLGYASFNPTGVYAAEMRFIPSGSATVVDGTVAGDNGTNNGTNVHITTIAFVNSKQMTLKNGGAQHTMSVTIYKLVETELPDFNSVEANLYGWKLRGKGDLVTDLKQIPVTSDRLRVVFRGAPNATEGKPYFRVNNIDSGYKHVCDATDGQAGDTYPKAWTASGFTPYAPSFFDNWHNGYVEIEVDYYQNRVSMRGTVIPKWTDDTATLTWLNNFGGELYTGAPIETVAVGVDAGSGGTYEVYEWGKIDIPIVSSAGLVTYEISVDQQLSINGYYIVDTTIGPISISMPTEAVNGDEIIILDAMRTFGTVGHECTLNPGETLIEGNDSLIDLDATGEEYKLKYVGGSMGWRMI